MYKLYRKVQNKKEKCSLLPTFSFIPKEILLLLQLLLFDIKKQ